MVLIKCQFTDVGYGKVGILHSNRMCNVDMFTKANSFSCTMISYASATRPRMGMTHVEREGQS